MFLHDLFGPLPKGFHDQLGNGRRAVIAGVRPEDFGDAGPRSADAGGEYIFSTTVEMVEWLGADLFLHFDLPVDSAARLTRSASLPGSKWWYRIATGASRMIDPFPLALDAVSPELLAFPDTWKRLRAFRVVMPISALAR